MLRELKGINKILNIHSKEYCFINSFIMEYDTWNSKLEKLWNSETNGFLINLRRFRREKLYTTKPGLTLGIGVQRLKYSHTSRHTSRTQIAFYRWKLQDSKYIWLLPNVMEVHVGYYGNTNEVIGVH